MRTSSLYFDLFKDLKQILRTNSRHLFPLFLLLSMLGIFLQFIKNHRIFWRSLLIGGSAAVLLTACHQATPIESMVRSITPYRMSIVQGNFVSREAADRVHIGMSREEVRNILGSPLLVDPFHPNRWDYVFYFKRGSTDLISQRHFIVHFEAERVVGYSGGEQLPCENDLIQAVDGDRKN